MAEEYSIESVGLTPEVGRKILYEMILIRRFEEKCAQMYGLRKIGGFCHLYIGQEAVCTGTIATLDLSKDYVLTAYRDHGHALSMQMEPKVVMAELYGKITGCSRGKGGSMHLFDKHKHFYGGHGIVGAHLPLAAGIALKIRYLEEDGVVLCFFGDGAIHQGAFHESLNMARIWNLPVIYICENNQYGMGTDFRRVSSVHDFSVMAHSYSIPGRQVDGGDVLAIYAETRKAVQQARDEHTPTFLEMRTYRYMGHSMSDPAKYRTREELDEKRSLDPIKIFQKQLVEASIVKDSDVETMEEEIKQAVEDAVSFAEESDEPARETLYEDVLVHRPA